MGERVELEKDILKTFIAATMETLVHKMNSFEEGMVMIEILDAEMAKLRKIAASMKKSEESYEQDSTISSTTFKVIYDEDGLNNII